MAEAELQAYLGLTPQQIRTHLLDMLARDPPAPGKHQVPFNAVETLLCYSLFSQVDPHRYGGANIGQVPAIVGTMAVFFRRTPGSITSKMLNLDGSRQHSARHADGNHFSHARLTPAIRPSADSTALRAALRAHLYALWLKMGSVDLRRYGQRGSRSHALLLAIGWMRGRALIGKQRDAFGR